MAALLDLQAVWAVSQNLPPLAVAAAVLGAILSGLLFVRLLSQSVPSIAVQPITGECRCVDEPVCSP
jgi:hypothetical protein